MRNLSLQNITDTVTKSFDGVREALIGRFEKTTDAAASTLLGEAGPQCLVMNTTIRLAE